MIVKTVARPEGPQLAGSKADWPNCADKNGAAPLVLTMDTIQHPAPYDSRRDTVLLYRYHFVVSYCSSLVRGMTRKVYLKLMGIRHNGIAKILFSVVCL